MIEKKGDGYHWFEFSLLQKFPVVARVYSRRGNLRKKAVVKESDIPVKKMLWVNQVHGTKISDARAGIEADGISTSTRGEALCLRIGDCQSAIFYDPEKHAIANVHAGWRGQVKEFYRITIEAMERRYGSKREDLRVCISPSLGPMNAEFLHYEEEFPKYAWAFANENKHMNLWELARWQLEREGIAKGHIEVANICTFDNPEDFFSYRRDKTKERNITLAALL